MEKLTAYLQAEVSKNGAFACKAYKSGVRWRL